jgi:hypothetical protein
LGFKKKGEAAAEAGNISLISRSCVEKLVRLVKALCNHVTSLPVDHRGDRTEAGRPSKAVPAIMHTVVKVGKKALGLLQCYGLIGEDGGDRAGARTDFVHCQHALVGKELLVAEEEKAGDRISNSMNGEHTQLVLSHYKWMFGNIMAEKYQQLAHVLSMYFGQIYSSAQPLPQSRLACWIFGNLTFNLTNLLDWLATAKDKSTKKPVTQSNHFHIIAEKIPRFHEGCSIPLLRLLAREAYQKVSKQAGLKRSNRKSDKVETMYREE